VCSLFCETLANTVKGYTAAKPNPNSKTNPNPSPNLNCNPIANALRD